MNRIHFLPVAALLLGCALLTGCVTRLAEHGPTSEGIRQLRDSGMSRVRVGAFALASGVPVDTDQHVSIRGRLILPTDGVSFAQFLRDALLVDLRAAGKFDAAAPTELRGELLKSELHASGTSEGHGTLAARFHVSRGGQVLFDKELEARDTWPSSLMTPWAIRNGRNGYADLYTKLLLGLYADKQFIDACTVAGAGAEEASSSPPPPPSPTPPPR